MTEFRLDGRKALVTGANAGIGQAIATALGGAGAHVVCAGRSVMDDTIGRIKAAGGAASGLDVRIPTKPATHSDQCVGRGPDAPWKDSIEAMLMILPRPLRENRRPDEKGIKTRRR